MKPSGTERERVHSVHFAEGESELEVRGLTSTGHDSAVCADETEWHRKRACAQCALRRRRKRTGGERFNKHRARQCRVRRLNRVDKRPKVLRNNTKEKRANSPQGDEASDGRDQASIVSKRGQGRNPCQGAGVKPLPELGHRKRACAQWALRRRRKRTEGERFNKHRARQCRVRRLNRVAPKESVCPVGTSPKAKAN